MNGVKVFVVCHLILVPIGILIIADDAEHPERWGLWYCDPNISIPYCVVGEIVLTAGFGWLWLQKHRREKGLRLLRQANRLLAEGSYKEAGAAFEEGKRLLRLDQ
jgi:hypothetical protein